MGVHNANAAIFFQLIKMMWVKALQKLRQPGGVRRSKPRVHKRPRGIVMQDGTNCSQIGAGKAKPAPIINPFSAQVSPKILAVRVFA
jgi:hypothetical protein